MSVGIIVKKSASHSLFRPHMNQATGKFHHTKDDYLSTVKKMGLEPYKGSIKPKTSKPYSGVSDEAKRMMNSVTYDKSGKPNVGDRYIEKLKSMGVKAVPKEIRDKRSGGMYAS